MRTIKLWMLAAILICGTTAVLTSCTDKIDNPSQPTAEVDEAPDFPELEIDPNEFQPIDISVALLGSLSSSAEEYAAEYWFTNMTGQVTDETLVVITDEITDANKEDILKVLNRFGTLLVVEPNEDNVRQYGEYFGLEADADYSKLELLGLTGFGDRFVSYKSDDVEAAGDIPPSSVAEDDIWDIAPEEYLRLKAFAQWVDKIDKKYTDYQEELAERQKAIDDAKAALEAGDEAAATRAMTRADQAGSDKKDEIKIDNMRGVDLTSHLFVDRKFKSYPNKLRSDDEDICHLDVTCNYSFKPLYEFPKGNTPGADYYIVETSVNWDCSETLKGNKIHPHGDARDRRSYLFFPVECQFHSEPLPTQSHYTAQMLAGSGGDLKPENVKHNKTVTNTRTFNINGNVSGGFYGGSDKGSSATGAGPATNTSGSNMGGNIDASLGIGASWTKTENFTVEEYDVAKVVQGQKVGHTITVPGGDEGYRPRMVNKSLDKGIEVPNGVNFRKTLSTNESWVWKVSGTSPDTNDASIKVRFTATPTVSWSSYFYTYEEWGVKESSYTMSEVLTIPAPNRKDQGALKITNTGDDNDNHYYIFGVKAIDVTDESKPFVAYENFSSVFVKYGEILNLALPANRKYDIELQMGRRVSKAKTYHMERAWTVESIATTGKAQELETDALFVEVKTEKTE